MVPAADMTQLLCERPLPFASENSLNNMVEPEAPLGEVTKSPVPVASFDVPYILLAVALDDQYEARTVTDDGQSENDDQFMDELKQKN